MSNLLVVGGVFREVLNGDTKPQLRYGGSGLSAAVCAARLGATVTLLSFVGKEDEYAVRAELQSAGINDQFVIALDGASGTFVFPTKISDERPWPMYRPPDALPSQVPAEPPTAEVVLAFGIPGFDPIAAGWLDHLADDAMLLWDRQGWLSHARGPELVRGLAPARKIYIANEQEVTADRLNAAVGAAPEVLPPMGFCAAIIKRGIAGVKVLQRTESGLEETHVPSFPVRTNVTVGSGDVFAGAVAARLLGREDLRRAARWGCAAASIAIASGANLLGSTALAKTEHLLRVR